MQYHYHLQGFIYNLLRGSKYHQIHDKEGYKFFCFSNIFPAKALEKGDLRTLIVSSPDNEFIAYLYEALQQWSSDVKVGGMEFKIDFIEKLEVPLTHSAFVMITGTPIIIRVPREKYKAYNIDPKGQYDYVYWRSDHPIDLFLSQIENNMMRKHAEYSRFDKPLGMKRETGNNLPLIHFIQKFRLKKQISTRVPMKGFDQVIIGTVWEFEFDTSANMDMIRFALDAGLGERNSLGFGFMNLINK
jgi:CRISPR-associated endoribonuclease Cas6